MRVKELIEELKKYDEDNIVMLKGQRDFGSAGGCYERERDDYQNLTIVCV